MSVKGYKVFNPDWTCRGFKYEVGKTYEEDIEPELCQKGFHFCEKAIDCFNYYSFTPDNKVAEVLALGDIDEGENKSCTNKIKIVREIPWSEVFEIVNTGKGCTGLGNTGNGNSGDYNTGNYNSGNRNSGEWNSGDYNSGDYNSGYNNSGNRNDGNCNSGYGNSGHFNSGNYNSGDYNSGNYNSGNYNSGDWNETYYSNGCFNTVEQKIYLFNKPSEWTYKDWENSQARYLLKLIPKNHLEYITFNNMSNEEKEEHPEAKIKKGYLLKTDDSKNVMEWWHSLSDDDRNIILSIPNFDKEIFKKITGIDVDE